jgi:integrase
MVPRKGPFTLHVPRNGWPGRILAAICETRSKMPPATYVFLPNPTLSSEVMTLVLEAERRIHAEYEKYFAHRIDLRALRRTGLSRLAQCEKVPLEVVLTISRHSNIKTLEVYLQKGVFHGAQASQQQEAFMTA